MMIGLGDCQGTLKSRGQHPHAKIYSSFMSVRVGGAFCGSLIAVVGRCIRLFGHLGCSSGNMEQPSTSLACHTSPTAHTTPQLLVLLLSCRRISPPNTVSVLGQIDILSKLFLFAHSQLLLDWLESISFFFCDSIGFRFLPPFLNLWLDCGLVIWNRF